MSLEQFMPGGVKIRCGGCDKVIKGAIRRLTTKKRKDTPFCRDCFGKKLRKKKKEEQ